MSRHSWRTKAATRHFGANELSQGADILLRILRAETARLKGDAVLLSSLGSKLKSEWKRYRKGCLNGLVKELTKAGRATRGKSKHPTLSLPHAEASMSATKETKTSSPRRPQRTGARHGSSRRHNQVSSKKPCFNFAKGQCRRGDACPFSHLETSPRQLRGRSDNNDANHRRGSDKKRHVARNRSRNISSLRNWFERCIMNGKDFSRLDGGRKFLRVAATEFDEDGPELLYRLVAPNEFGAKMLTNALLRVSNEPQFLTKSVLPFLDRLGRNDMRAGTCTEGACTALMFALSIKKIIITHVNPACAALVKILEVVSRVHGLLRALCDAIKSGQVWQDSHITTASWCMVKLGCESKSSRNDPAVRALADVLCDRVSPYATKLRTVFHGTSNGMCVHVW